MIRTVFVIVSALTCFCMTGCASSPESIAPAYISDMSYSHWTCEQLAQEQPRLVSALSTACDAQRRCRANDTAGVIFLGLPVSSLSGSNMASEVARLKGELQALQRAGILKNCSLPQVPPNAFVSTDTLQQPEADSADSPH